MELVSVVQKTKEKQGKLAVKDFLTNDLNSKCRMKKIMRSILRRFPQGALERGHKENTNRRFSICDQLD
jgi:hypothetical protein